MTGRDLLRKAPEFFRRPVARPVSAEWEESRAPRRPEEGPGSTAIARHPLQALDIVLDIVCENIDWGEHGCKRNSGTSLVCVGLGFCHARNCQQRQFDGLQQLVSA